MIKFDDNKQLLERPEDSSEQYKKIKEKEKKLPHNQKTLRCHKNTQTKLFIL